MKRSSLNSGFLKGLGMACENNTNVVKKKKKPTPLILMVKEINHQLENPYNLLEQRWKFLTI